MSHVFRRLQCQLACGSSRSSLLPGRRPASKFASSHHEFHQTTLTRQSTKHIPSRKAKENEQDAKAKRLNQKVVDEEEQKVKAIQNQVNRPWHRQGADKPPIGKDGPVTKGPYQDPTRVLIPC